MFPQFSREFQPDTLYAKPEDAKTLAEARREVSHLNELVAQLSGHANSKQKIQRVMKIEQDNVALRR